MDEKKILHKINEIRVHECGFEKFEACFSLDFRSVNTTYDCAGYCSKGGEAEGCSNRA